MMEAISLARFFELAPESLMVVDHAQNILKSNLEARTRFDGLALPEKRLEDLVVPEDCVRFNDQWNEMLERATNGNGGTAKIEARLSIGENEWHWFCIDLSVDGATIYVILHDTQPLHTMEAKLSYYTQIIDQLPEALIASDFDFNIQIWNKVAEELYGWQAEEVIGKEVRSVLDSLFFGQTRENAIAELKQEGIWRGEINYRHKDGHRVNIWLSTLKIQDHNGADIGVIGINQDISPIKQARDLIVQSEHHYQMLFHSLPIGMLEVEWSSAAGLEPASRRDLLKIINLNSAIFHSLALQDLAAFEKTYRDFFIDYITRLLYENPAKTPDEGQQTLTLPNMHGEECHLLTQLVHIGEKKENKQRLLLVCIDVTERHNAENALRQTEQRYRVLVENLPNVGITLYATDKRYILADGKELIKSGLNPEQMIGKKPTEFVPHPFGIRIEEIMEVVLQGQPYRYETHYLGNYYDVIHIPIFNEAGKVINGLQISYNITPLRNTQEALRLSDAQHRAILQHLPNMAVGLYDLEKRFTIIAGTLVTELGLKPQEIVGKALEEILLSTEQVKLVSEKMEITFTGLISAIEGEYMGHTLRNSYVPVRDEQGTIIGGLMVVQDITQVRTTEQALRQSEARLQEAQRVGRIGSWEFEILTQSVYWSDYMYTLLDRDPALGPAVDREEILAAIHPEDHPIYLSSFAQIFQQANTCEFEYRVLHRNGNMLYVYAIIESFANADGIVYKVIGTLQDITAQKEAELTLKSALERERQLGEMRARFIAITSHEFRTPLATILTSAELLDLYGDRITLEQRQTRIDKIRDQVQHLTMMLDDILLVGQMESMGWLPKLETVYYQEWVAHIINEFRLNRPDYTFNISISGEPIEAQLDKKLFWQIINNLISNAVKYSKPTTPIEVRVSATDTHFQVEVQDQGIGIAPEDQPHIFEAFYRADNVTTIQGTGLGLSITKQAVEALGGSITFISGLDSGTTFTIILPLHQ